MTSLDNTKEKVLNKLVASFFNHSLIFSLEANEIEWMNWDQQEAFLNATVHNKIVQNYPPSREFCRLYFKKLISYLEPSQEIHDDFYTFLCNLFENEMKDDYCYRHYAIGNDFQNLITIKETKNMVVNGTTGMKTWQAALMLADWIICNKHLFKGKKVLELGCGVGFTGIAIAKNCDIHSLIFTDCHTDVLRTICDNVTINFPFMEHQENKTETVFQDKDKKLGVMMLDWNCIDNLNNDVIPDIIIGADIIYDPTILQPLCNTIRSFFNKNNNLEVYIANIIRNEETYRSFLKTLASMNLTYEEMPHSKSIFINWDEIIEKCLLRIKIE